MHLEWRSILARERQTVSLLSWINGRTAANRYEVLCGDFNCTPDSSVYRCLRGQQSLLGHHTRSWHDLPRYAAEREGTTARPTLDVWTNPRWRDSPTLELPMRLDWIMLRDVFNTGLRYPEVPMAGLFGVEPSAHNGLVPSDHYGVFVDMEFAEPESRG